MSAISVTYTANNVLINMTIHVHSALVAITNGSRYPMATAVTISARRDLTLKEDY